MKKLLSSSLVFYMVIVGLPTTAALFRIFVHQEAVHLGYALSQAELQQRTLSARARELEVEVAAARSPARLVTMARALGLRPPSLGQNVSGQSMPAHLARADVAKARHAIR